MENNHSTSILLVSAAVGLVVISFFSLGGKEKKSDEKTSHKKNWGYSGAEGPKNWAKLSADFSACSGKKQSPVNLTGFIKANLNPIDFKYHTSGNEIVHNGHTIQINYPTGSYIKVDGQHFELKQLHLHAPSENHINGTSYPLEIHFVHADKDGKLVVIAVMFEEGAANKELAKAWLKMPSKSGITNNLSSGIKADKLLPSLRKYYRFEGSLTTPPCSEGVKWIVMKKPMTASKEQIKQFSDIIGHPNNRPIQAINGRKILQ